MVIFAGLCYTIFMNARDYKIFSPDEYYHIYNRGNNREPIFLDKQDYTSFLKRLRIVLGLERDFIGLRINPFPAKSFTIIAFCLMANHFHFLIHQNGKIPISSLMNKLSTSYARYFNAKYNRVGNIFQDTFKAKLVDNDEYLMYLSAYIHNNPEKPFGYEYSSLNEYLANKKPDLVSPDIVLGYFSKDRGEYRKFVKGYTQRMHESIRDLTFDE